MFFYQPSLVPSYRYPSSIDWGNWWSWNEAASYATDRAYDYVYVTAAYWALYRVARNYPSLVKTHTWQWYINQAVLTVLTMTNGQVRRFILPGSGYASFSEIEIVASVSLNALRSSPTVWFDLPRIAVVLIADNDLSRM